MNDSEARLFQVIRNDKPLEDYTFKKLAECENPSRWLIPLKDRGYFSGEKNPRPQEVKDQPGYYTIPLWNVLPFLEHAAKSNKENPSNNITNALAEIIDSIISYRDKNDKRIDNYRTDWFITKIIFMLPYEKWGDKYINFIGEALTTSFGGSLIQSEIGNSVLPALIENKKVVLILKLLDIIFNFTKIEGKKLDKIKPLMEEHWLRDALKKFKKDIAELCGIEAAEVAINRIKSIVEYNDSKFGYIWIPTIEDHTQNKFPEKYECQLVYFVRDMFEQRNGGDVKNKVEELLTYKYSIFIRIAIHTINKHYREIGDLFWKWKDNPLNEDSCKHELYQLLKMNCSSFSKEQINTVLEWIESKEYGNFDKEREEEAKAYYKKKWLSSILETEDKDIKAAYDKYDKINPGKIAHPGFSTWSEGGAVRHISPIKKEEILSKSNEDIVRYLNEYKEEEEKWSLEKVGELGLSNCFKECVLEKPEKFAADLAPFFNVERNYQQTLLRGFIEAWNTKKDFSVDGVLDFICQIIESESFWNETYGKQGFNYRNWIVSQIAEFIESGTSDKSHEFDAKYMRKIERILLILVERAESVLDEKRSIIDSVFTSPRGSVFSAMITYSLRHARLLDKEQKIRWPESIKNDFTKRLDRDIETSLDYSVTLGKYLGNLVYLDNKWIFDNLDGLFPRNNKIHWQAAFTGYLSYSQNIYENIYSAFRENGHYKLAIETDFPDEYIGEKLVQHICIGFLEDWEKLEEPDSLICLLLKKQHTKYLSEVIHFLWTIKEGEPLKKLKERIKPLWKAFFDLVSKHENERDYQNLISKLNIWLDIVDEIDDDIKEWVKLTAKYVNVGYRASNLIKYLTKHVDKTPKNVAEIYVEMLNEGAYPDYNKEEIRKIVESLYQKKEKEYADTICNMYGEVGYYFLRDLYEQNN